ncbi:MAG: glycosyltransferase [Verrucomicrobia bacterium]|nr:glycosyltransferase [Verrucomicrobiota bacterium]
MPAPTQSPAPVPLVSICIITYQHAAYIRQCVEGMLAQQTGFPCEILIGEDDSSDGTREICQELARAHPERIRLLLQRRADVVYVDGRPRGTHNLVATLAAARGEFVALCEGDDYWTDPEKLATQVAYLRAHPECVGCFHEATVVDGDGRETDPHYFKSQKPKIQEQYDRRDCLVDLMSKYATCSLVYRRDAFRDPPAWYLQRSCDFFFDLVITAHGKLGFIDRCMAAYRRHRNGVWTSKSRLEQILELLSRYRLLLNDPHFRTHYGAETLAQAEMFQRMILLHDDAERAKLEATTDLQRQLAHQSALIAKLQTEREQWLAHFAQQRTSAAPAPPARGAKARSAFFR